MSLFYLYSIPLPNVDFKFLQFCQLKFRFLHQESNGYCDHGRNIIQNQITVVVRLSETRLLNTVCNFNLHFLFFTEGTCSFGFHKP